MKPVLLVERVGQGRSRRSPLVVTGVRSVSRREVVSAEA